MQAAAAASAAVLEECSGATAPRARLRTRARPLHSRADHARRAAHLLDIHSRALVGRHHLQRRRRSSAAHAARVTARSSPGAQPQRRAAAAARDGPLCEHCVLCGARDRGGAVRDSRRSRLFLRECLTFRRLRFPGFPARPLYPYGVKRQRNSRSYKRAERRSVAMPWRGAPSPPSPPAWRTPRASCSPRRRARTARPPGAPSPGRSMC